MRLHHRGRATALHGETGPTRGSGETSDFMKTQPTVKRLAFNLKTSLATYILQGWRQSEPESRGELRSRPQALAHRTRLHAPGQNGSASPGHALGQAPTLRGSSRPARTWTPWPSRVKLPGTAVFAAFTDRVEEHIRPWPSSRNPALAARWTLGARGWWEGPDTRPFTCGRTGILDLAFLKRRFVSSLLYFPPISLLMASESSRR